MIDHPMFESALSQVIEAEDETNSKIKRKNDYIFKNGGDKFLDASGKAISVTLELKSYKQHSSMIREVCMSYESLIE